MAFTINNYSEADEVQLQEAGRAGIVSFIIYGREVGAQGTPHLQGYCEAENRKRFITWKRILGSRAHIEAAKSTRAKNATYVSKEGSVWQFPEEADVHGEPAVGYSGLLSAINAGTCLITSPSSLRL